MFFYITPNAILIHTISLQVFYELCRIILSCIYRKEGNTAKADSVREKAMAMADSHYKLMILTDMWNEKKAEGKHMEASELAERMTALRDTLAKLERTDNIREKQVTADMAASISEETTKHNNTLNIVIALAIIISIAMATISPRQYKKKENAQNALAKAAKAIKELAQKYTALAAVLKSMETETQKSNAAAEELKKAYAELGRQLTQEKSKHQKELLKATEQHIAALKECTYMFHHVFMENGSIVAWSSNEIARFLGYWRSINSEDYEMIMQKYTKLTEWNLIILILRYRNKTNNEICTIMGMNEHTLAQALYRLKKKER